MIKIFIDAGHGGKDPGASGHGLREKDLTLDISKRIKRYLDNNYTGHTTKLSRTGDTSLTLSQRTSDANKWGADYVLSVHINAGGGTGFESFVYNGKLYKITTDIRSVIHNEIMKRIDVADRGKKKANFHMVREPNASAMLTENLFIDTKSDADKLKDSKFLQSVAEGHAIGLAKAFSLKAKSGKSTTKPSKPTKTATSHTKPTKSISTMASEVIAGNHGSGHVNRRKSLGISDAEYQKVRAEVNRRAGSTHRPATKKSIAQMVTEVLNGQHGNGHNARRKSLGISQSQYSKVRHEVNRRLSGGSNTTKLISQMATEVIAGKHGNGHANRRKSLGVNQATYNKVRAEINRRYR